MEVLERGEVGLEMQEHRRVEATVVFGVECEPVSKRAKEENRWRGSERSLDHSERVAGEWKRPG